MSDGRLTLIPIHGIGEAQPGDDVATLIGDGLETAGLVLEDGDIIVVTHKIISKAEGRIAEAATDAEYRALAEAEAAEIIRRRGDLIITITSHGFVCANAGVDRSNVPAGQAVMLPKDPDRSAHMLRMKLERRFGAAIAVVVSDTFGRPWRRGLTDVAIGVSGIDPIEDLRGTTDAGGRVLDVTEVAIVDEIASAADLVMGKAAAIPAAIVRGLSWNRGTGRATDLVRPAAEDMFR